jgi:hypothetical protein
MQFSRRNGFDTSFMGCQLIANQQNRNQSDDIGLKNTEGGNEDVF